MQSLLNGMGDISIYQVGKVTPSGDEIFSKDFFLEKYQEYIQALKSKKEPDFLATFREFFSTAFTKFPESVFSIPAGVGRQITRASKPIVQLQLHMMGYSEMEKKFRPMVLGKGSIHWGIQFSYPQLYQNPESKNIEKVFSDNTHPNTTLFRFIQKWMREHTVPTPFIVEGQIIRVPMRLGKQCFSWINEHPQLQALGISVLEK